MNLDPREIARYLGIRGKALDPQGAAWADQCQGELAQAVTPRHLGRRLPSPCFRGRAGTWTTTSATAGRASSTPSPWARRPTGSSAGGAPSPWPRPPWARRCAPPGWMTCARPTAPPWSRTWPRGSTSRPLQPWLWGLEPGGPAVGPGPPPGPQAPGTHPHRRGDAGAREVGNRPGGHQRPERGGLRAKVHALHQTRLPLPGRASGGSPRTLMFLFQPRERALSGARSRCLYLTRKGRLSQ